MLHRRPGSGCAVVGGRCGTRRVECRCANGDRDRHEAICRDARVLRRGYSSENPGVSIKQGNGPRDLGISIRGSNARNGFGIRNIVILEDGFPVTQPDGLSRSDLIDPHAYSSIDVWRGPSSALFGNYATGGALNFRTRPGGEIKGVQYGVDVGSFNYLNNYVSAGTKTGNFEGSVFISDVRGDGYYGYSSFDTQTINMLLTYRPITSDTITVKAIDNKLDTELPFRMSLNQFKQNPFQKGCKTGGRLGARLRNEQIFGNRQYQRNQHRCGSRDRRASRRQSR